MLPTGISLLLVFLLGAGQVHSQSGHAGGTPDFTLADSLQRELEQSESDSTGIRLMLELAREVMDTDSALAKSQILRAREIAELLPNTKALGQSYQVMGELQSYHGHYEEAIRQYDRALAYFSEADEDELFFETTRLKGNVYLFLSEYDQAVNLYNSALDFYRRNEMNIGISRCLNNLGVIQRFKGEYGEALLLYEESVLYLDSVENAYDISQAYINMGNVFVHLGSYERALEYYQKALVISEREGYLNNISFCLSNSGVVQNKCRNYTEAHRLYTRALTVSESINDQIKISNCLINIGTNFSEMGRPEEGLDYVRRGMAIKQELGDDRTISNCYIHMAEIHLMMEEYERAIELFESAIPVKEQLGDREGLVRCLLGLSSVLLKQNELTEAGQMADRGLEMAHSIGAMEHLQQGYALKRDIALSMNDFQAAYQFVNLHYRYRDSLMGEATTRAVMEMEFRSRSRSLEQENENLKVQSSLQTELMRKRNAFMYSVLGIALLLAAGLALVGYFLRRLRLSSNKLEEKNLVITRQNIQLDQMVRNKDRLMSIIAHDLRGTIGNQLTGLEILNRMQEDQEGTLQDRNKLMKNLKNSASYSLDLLENLLHWSRIDESESFFHPEEVDLEILLSNTLELFRETADQKRLEVKRELEGPLTCEADRIMVETIFRNLISNAIKFSDRGGQIVIRAWISDGDLIFSVSDQGIGMDTDHIHKITSDLGVTRRGTANEKGAGIGLALVREFTALHGGSLQIESEPGKGSTFQVVIPCKK